MFPTHKSSLVVIDSMAAMSERICHSAALLLVTDHIQGCINGDCGRHALDIEQDCCCDILHGHIATPKGVSDTYESCIQPHDRKSKRDKINVGH
jgi:hypothetical protein